MPRGVQANHEEVRRLREGKGWTQEQLAERTRGQVSVRTIERIEAGASRSSRETLRAIAQALAVPVESLLPAQSPSGSLAERVTAWLQALRYDFARDGISAEGGFHRKVWDPRGTQTILVRCVEDVARPEHLRYLREATEAERADRGWLIVPGMVEDVVRRQVARPENQHLECFTFDELLERDARFVEYRDWMAREVRRRSIEKFYVPLGATRTYLDPVHRVPDEVFEYSAAEGGLERYLDRWLEDPTRVHVSILGKFGTGKTFFALHYAWKLLQLHEQARKEHRPRPRFPLYVRLRDFSWPSRVESIISEFFFHQHRGDLPSYEAFDLLNRMGRLLILLDGFDEMVGGVDRLRMVEGFWKLAEVAVPGSKVILTCRTEHFPEAVQAEELFQGRVGMYCAGPAAEVPRFEVIEIAPFDERQIRLALEKREIDPATIHRVLGNSDLLGLARHPLLLEFLLEDPAGLTTGHLDPAHVFLHAIRRKLRREIDEKHTFTSNADKLFFMAELSWEMLRTGQLSLRHMRFPEQLKNLFGPKLDDESNPDRWRHDLLGRTMLTRTDEGVYEPAHRSVAEWFSALKLVAELGVLAPEFTALAGESEDIDPALPAREYTWSEYFRRPPRAVRKAPLSRFAPELEGRDPPAEPERSYHAPVPGHEPAANRSFPLSMSTTRVLSLPRTALTFAAGMVSSAPESLHRLALLCWETSGRIAVDALELLPFLVEHARILVPMLLENAGGAPLRAGIAWVLGELGVRDEEVRQALRRTAQTLPANEGCDPASAWQSAFALMKLGEFGGDPERNIEGPVRYLVGILGSRRSLEEARVGLLRTAAARDPAGARIDQRDILALAAHRDRGFDFPALSRELRLALDFASDLLGRRVYYLAWLCGYFRDTGAIGDLVRAADHPHSSVRNCVAEALGRIGQRGPTVLTALEKLLGDDYYRTRLHAALSLADLDAAGAVPRLTEAQAREEVPCVARAMRQALDRLRARARAGARGEGVYLARASCSPIVGAEP